MIPSWVIEALKAKGYKRVEPAPTWGPNAIMVEDTDGRVAVRDAQEGLLGLLDGTDPWVRAS